MTKIVFYFPYREECGVPVLFLRMARWIAQYHSDEYEVYVCDYPDGAMARNIEKDDKVKVYESGTSEGIIIKNGDFLIMQSMIPYYWPKELHLEQKAKVFYWTLHFRNLTPSLLPFPGLRDLPYNNLSIYRCCSLFYKDLINGISKMINDMMAHNAHYYMDISTQKQTELHTYIQMPTGMDYLPVPASDYKGPLKIYNPTKDVIDACWLGRISYEKTPILIHILEKCSQYALQHNKRIHFHVLGFGEYAGKIDNLHIENEFFTKTAVTSIRFNEIDNYLLSNVDIMFAMGTSALESAKLGIPTVLVDYTSTCKPINGDYIFNYIDKRVGYDLAHCISDNDLEADNNSLNIIFEQLLNNYNIVAANSRKHFCEKHSLTSVGVKFYNILQEMDYTFDMINPKTIQRPWLLEKYNKLRGFER